MSYRGKEEDQAAFPDRVCECCGRKGGGHPTKGLDNVIVDGSGRQLCGHCCQEFAEWFWEKRDAALVKWLEAKKAKEAA